MNPAGPRRTRSGLGRANAGMVLLVDVLELLLELINGCAMQSSICLKCLRGM